jgi:hypothetical protein
MKYLYLLFVILTAMTLQALSPEEEASLRVALGEEEFARVMGTVPQPAAQGPGNDWGLSEKEMQEALKAEEQWVRQSQPAARAAAASGAAGYERDDAALAALLQQQEEEMSAQERAGLALAERLAREQQEERDAAMAARFAAMDLDDGAFGAAASGSAKPHIIQDIEKRRKFYAEMPALHKAFNAKVQANMPQNGAGEYVIDVHVFNRFIRETFEQYVALVAETLETKADYSWVPIHVSLQQFLTENPVIKGRLTQTEAFMNGQGKAYLQGGAVDPEIGYSYPNLLSRCWDLILRGNFEGPVQEIDFIGAKHLVSVTALEKLAYAYHENIAEQGGCAPGFAGRLARVYIELMNMSY